MRNYCSNATTAQFRSLLKAQLNDIKAAGTYKSERVITSPQRTEINVQGTQATILNFCANNYLGLSAHPGNAQGNT